MWWSSSITMIASMVTVWLDGNRKFYLVFGCLSSWLKWACAIRTPCVDNDQFAWEGANILVTSKATGAHVITVLCHARLVSKEMWW